MAKRRNSKSTWAGFERRMAKRLGGRRIAATGERCGIDVDAGAFIYQIKLGRRMPAYLREWLDGICAHATNANTGAVVWKPLGVRDENAVVLVRLSDWEALHGK